MSLRSFIRLSGGMVWLELQTETGIVEQTVTAAEALRRFGIPLVSGDPIEHVPMFTIKVDRVLPEWLP